MSIYSVAKSNVFKLFFFWGGGRISIFPFLFSVSWYFTLCVLPYVPKQNGTVERKHRHIVKIDLTILTHFTVPPSFLPEAFSTAIYLINQLPSPTLDNKSPFFLLYRYQPNYLSLCTFGCACWPHLWPYTKHKLQNRSLTCVFMGYNSHHRGFICHHILTGR